MRLSGVMKRFGQFGCAKHVCDALQVTGLLNFRFERVANSFIQALECSDFQFGAR